MNWHSRNLSYIPVGSWEEHLYRWVDKSMMGLRPHRGTEHIVHTAMVGKDLVICLSVVLVDRLRNIGFIRYVYNKGNFQA